MSRPEPSDRIDSLLAYVEGIYPERDLTAKSVAWRLRRAAHYVDTEIKRGLAPLGMEMWELEILAGIRRYGGTVTMGQLQDIAQLTSGAITNRVARLERDGYVKRDVDSVDRRQVLVTLTPAGRERAEQVIDVNQRVEEEIFAAVDRGLQLRLSSDLRQLLLATEGPDPRA